MKQWVVGSWALGLLLVGACQPEEACSDGQELVDGTCVEAGADDGGEDGRSGELDASQTEDAGAPDGGHDPMADASMMGGDAGGNDTSKVPFCENRVPLTDEDKYGLQCDTANPGSTCGSLECSFGYCNKDCDLADPCSCPGGSVCTDFGVSTACMPSWGWPCTEDGACRAEAPVCIEAEGYCTSQCDPNDVKTCPDTWECVAGDDGNVCAPKK